MANGMSIEFDKLRLFIIDEQNRARSQFWYFCSWENGLYVGPELTGRTFKLSFHANDGPSLDGCNSQWGLTRDYREIERDLGTSNVPQPIRWKRPETPSVGTAHVASIMFPTDFLGGTINPFKSLKSDQKRFALPLAPSGHAIEVGIFFSFEDLLTIKDRMRNAGGTFISCVALPGGENVAVTARQIPFNPDRIPLASERGRVGWPSSGAPKVGEAIDNCGTILFDRPAEGQPALLAEINGITIKRN
jgi:hypothetical protein